MILKKDQVARVKFDSFEELVRAERRIREKLSNHSLIKDRYECKTEIDEKSLCLDIFLIKIRK